jgi:hypothetical protein
VLRKEYLGRKNAMLLQQWLAEQFNANRPGIGSSAIC